MQRHRALQPGSPGVVPSAPRRFLSNATDQCLQTHLPAFLAGTGISKRSFTLPKRLPVSRPPFRGQSSRPAPSTPCRSLDRKSTRLNSSHLVISYAVFCLKTKNTNVTTRRLLEWDAVSSFHGCTCGTT